jgi:hypothetical protein
MLIQISSMALKYVHYDVIHICLQSHATHICIHTYIYYALNSRVWLRLRHYHAFFTHMQLHVDM